MGDKSKIHWTDATWNPVTGCARVSGGCWNCYAEKMHKRLRAMGSEKYNHDFSEVRCHDDEKLLSQPARWAKPRRIFVNSMGDLFHPDVPFEFMDKVYQAMMAGPQHTYQVLTKRAGRMKAYLDSAPFDVPGNIHHGVTVENDFNTDRIDTLRRTRCPVKFVSFEPLLRLIGFVDLNGIDQVIIGGESGPGAREMREVWAESIVAEADRDGAKVFMKQFGTFWANENCLKGKGDDMASWPSWAKRREQI